MKTPPKSSNWPLLGSLPSLIKDPFGFIKTSREKYGDIYTLDLGLTKVIVLNNPKHGKYILQDNVANYPKGGGFWKAIRDMLGNGLIVSEGEFWLKQRRLMQSEFHRQRIAGLSNLMIEAIDQVYSQWEKEELGKTFEITDGFNHVTMNVILNALFGSALTPEQMSEAGEEMSICLDCMLQGTITNPLPDWMPLPGKAKFKRAFASFSSKVQYIIDQCREGKAGENHLLSMLLNVVDEESGEGMTDKQLLDEISILFIAGYETTSIALSWTVHFLLECPEVLAKLQTEIDEVLGKRKPSVEDFARLRYTRMVFHEVLRIRPPSYWLPRTALKDDEIDGYKIPAGTHMVSLTYAYHHHPDYWPEPEKFEPERFSPERSKDRARYSFLPFGLGQRLCIGKDFALVEGQLALAMLIQRFEMKDASGRKIVPQLATTLRPKKGIQVQLKKRS